MTTTNIARYKTAQLKDTGEFVALITVEKEKLFKIRIAGKDRPEPYKVHVSCLERFCL